MKFYSGFDTVDDRAESDIIYEYLPAEPSAIIKEEDVAASLKPKNTTGSHGLEVILKRVLLS